MVKIIDSASKVLDESPRDITSLLQSVTTWLGKLPIIYTNFLKTRHLLPLSFL